jgi:dihydropteroate synthase
MGRTYFRPIGLSYGEAALRSVVRGAAGMLAGNPAIAFHAVEMIQRNNGEPLHEIIPFGDMAQSDVMARIQERRPLSLRSSETAGPALMGIVNVTPDSFSDGGLHAETEAAIAHGHAMARNGAAIVDVGGESTRPGSTGVSLEEEKQRVIPVIEALSRAGYAVSVDTRKPQVMHLAAKAGATIINDVSALSFSDESLATAQELQLPVILMHAQGTPETMQADPFYDHVVLDVYDALEARIAACVEAGIPRDKLIIDPGIGFGKTAHHNLQLLEQLALFHGLGVPLLVGLSRKRFIGLLTGEEEARHRILGSAAGAVTAALRGAQILRVHDVKETRQALAVAMASVDPRLAGF